MVGLTIAGGELFALSDVSDGIEGHSPLLHFHHHVGFTSMVGMAQRIGRGRGIHRTLIRNGNHEDAPGLPLGFACTPAGFAQVDEFTSDLTYLVARWHGLCRERAQAVDATGAHADPVLLRVCRTAPGVSWR